RLPRQARIDVEADTSSVGAVVAVDDAPGTGAPRHPGLEVVDANDGRDAVESAKRLVVYPVPGQLIFARGPDERWIPREGQLESEQGHLLMSSIDQHPRELAPIRLRLSARRRLDSAPSTGTRPGVMGPKIPLQRPERAGIRMLDHKPVMQGGQVEPTVSVEMLEPVL